MSSPTSGPSLSSTPATEAGRRAKGLADPAATPSAPPSGGTQGSLHIAETVVSKIAAVAAREVNGIHQLGGGAARTMGAIRERIPGASTSVSQGVGVEVGETQAAVDIDVVAEYGVAIADLAAAARRNVIAAVQGMTGLQVVEVNINVNDVHLPSDDADAGSGNGEPRPPAPARVR